MPVIEEKPRVVCAGCAGAFASNQVVQLQGKSYCAACKENVLGDLKAGVSTSGIELAGIGARFVAQFVDGLIIGIPVMIIAFAIGLYQTAGKQGGIAAQLAQNLILSIPYLVYSGLALSNMGGRTIGKKVMKLRVVLVDGTEAAADNFWKREAGRWVLGLLPLVGLIDYLMAFQKGRRTLHDKMGGTIVVRVG